MRAAVIGIGSNSVRMLVADLEGAKGIRVCRDREATRLFAGLDEQKRLSAQSMQITANAVKNMAQHARSIGAQEVRLFATSATRDAANQQELAALLKQEADVIL